MTFTLRLCEHSELDRVFLTDRPVRVRRAARRVTALPAPPMPTDCPGWPPGCQPACLPPVWLAARRGLARSPSPSPLFPSCPLEKRGWGVILAVPLDTACCGEGEGEIHPSHPLFHSPTPNSQHPQLAPPQQASRRATS